MNSQLVTSNIPQSSAMGIPGSAQLPVPVSPAGRLGTRDGHYAAPASAANAAQPNDTTDTQPVESFEALLARQINDAISPALIAPSSANVLDAQTLSEPASSSSKCDPDKVLEIANLSNDPSGALVAMLQIPQEIKTPATKDLTNNATTHGNGAHNHLAANIDAARARAKVGMTAASDDRSVATISTTGNQAVLSASILETTKSDVNPSGVSVAASTALPNLLANNKLADTPQSIATLLGNSGWQEEFSQKISWMSTQQNHAATLHLNPPDLGPLDVVLNISDNQATALFTSPHSAVRDAIESALPKLREILADNGIMLGNTTVSDQPPRDRGTEGFMSQNPGMAAQRNGSGDLSKSTALSPADPQITSTRRRIGMVDIFA